MTSREWTTVGTAVRVASINELLRPRGCLAMLADSEIIEGERYQHTDDRLRHFASRILLRSMLTAAANDKVGPGEWRITRGSSGRLIVDQELSGHAIEVSISHAGDCVAAAVSRTGRPGIDLEPLAAANHDQQSLDPQWAMLTDKEQRFVNSLPTPRRGEAILAFWTAKEAIAKALGIPLERSSIIAHLQARETPSGIELSTCSPAIKSLTTRAFSAEGSDYCLSVALSAQAPKLGERASPKADQAARPD